MTEKNPSPKTVVKFVEADNAGYTYEFVENYITGEATKTRLNLPRGKRAIPLRHRIQHYTVEKRFNADGTPYVPGFQPTSPLTQTIVEWARRVFPIHNPTILRELKDAFPNASEDEITQAFNIYNHTK